MRKKIAIASVFMLMLGISFSAFKQEPEFQLPNLDAYEISGSEGCEGEYGEEKWSVVEKCDENCITCTSGGEENCCIRDHCDS